MHTKKKNNFLLQELAGTDTQKEILYTQQISELTVHSAMLNLSQSKYKNMTQKVALAANH